MYVKRSLKMAWPMVSSRLLVAMTNFFAMWLLSRLGSLELAAGALIYVAQITMTVVMGSLLFSLSPIAGRAYGAEDFEKIGGVWQQAWVLSLILTLPTILLLWWIGPILLYLHEPSALVLIAQSYFHSYIWAVIPMFFFMSNQMLMMGVGKQHVGLASSVVASLVLVPAALLLTYGKWGLPALGVKGVALGFAASLWSGFIFSSYFLFSQRDLAPCRFLSLRLWKTRAYLKQILSVGWPISVQTGGELFSWFATVLLLGWLGATALSVQQITNQYNVLIFLPIMGLSQATSILVGQAAGAKRYEEVHRLGITNISIGVVFMLMVILVYLVFPKLLISVFVDIDSPLNQTVVHLCIWVFGLSAFSLFFDNIRNVATGALRGVYDNQYPMILGLIMLWCVGLPLGALLAFSFHLGVIGFSLGSLFGMVITASLLLRRWNRRSHSLLMRAEENDAKRGSH